MTRNLKTLIIVATVAMGWSGLAYGQTGTVPGRIAGTPHDLASGTPTNPDGNEICVYCHTPHGANTTSQAPLWNKPATGATYQTYDATSTLDAPILSTVGSVSLACLTCHDGTQAPDVVLNAPGRGLAGSGGTAVTGGFSIQSTLPAVGSTNNAANLTADLRNDHPIGIVYAGQINSATSAKFDPDFVTPTSATINGATAWWVDTTGGTANRDKTDMILYARSDGTAGVGYVECGSCHDPHNDANGRFLRIANAGSAVCLACHTK